MTTTATQTPRRRWQPQQRTIALLLTAGAATWALFALSAATTPDAIAQAKAAAPRWPDLSTPVRVGGGSKDAAVIVGIERYMRATAVPGAAKNADDWYVQLVKGHGVPADRVKLLRNDEATLEHMEAALVAAAKAARPGGTLWFVFIGHGAPKVGDDGRGVDGLLLGADVQQTAVSLAARGLARQRVLDLMAKSAATKRVLVLDACFSGRTGDGGAVVQGLQPMVEMALAEVRRAAVLTAATARQFAGPLPGLGRPAFSYLALGALRGWGDEDGDGQITGAEVVAYAGKAMRTVVTGREQTPEASGEADTTLGRSGREAAPDLTAFVLAGGGANRGESGGRSKVDFGDGVDSEAPKVSVGDGAAMDLDNIPVEALELRTAAKKVEKEAGASCERKAEAWCKLAALSGDNPFRGDAQRACGSWRTHCEKLAALRGRLGGHYDKVRRVLALADIEAEAKKELVRALLRTYGALSDPRVAEARAWLAALEAGRAAVLVPEGMVALPAGTFMMGGPGGDDDELGPGGKAVRVTLSAFALDKTEVTAAAYGRCVAAGKCWAQATPFWFGEEREGADGCNGDKSERGNHPMNCVDWEQATAYCAFVGKRLPTEAEWEYAARGDGRRYVWGHAWPPPRGSGNFEGDDDGYAQTAPVGSFAADWRGLHDMAGNVWEWTSDAYGPYGLAVVSNPNVRGNSSNNRVLRGGSWGVDKSHHLRAASRIHNEPLNRSNDVGFRCARTL